MKVVKMFNRGWIAMRDLMLGSFTADVWSESSRRRMALMTLVGQVMAEKRLCHLTLW